MAMPTVPHVRHSDVQEKAEAFGAWIRERRKALGLTQKELAIRLDMSAASLGRMERGQSYPNADSREGGWCLDRLRLLLEEAE